MSIEQIRKLEAEKKALQVNVDSLQRANQFKWVVLIVGGVASMASMAFAIASVVDEQNGLSWGSLGVATVGGIASAIGIFKRDFSVVEAEDAEQASPSRSLDEVVIDRGAAQEPSERDASDSGHGWSSVMSSGSSS